MYICMHTFQLNCLWTFFFSSGHHFVGACYIAMMILKMAHLGPAPVCSPKLPHRICLKMGSSLRKVAILGGFDLSLISYAPLDIDTVLYAYNIIYIYMYIYIYAHLPSDLHIACAWLCFSCSFRGMKRSALKRSFSRPCLQRGWRLLRTSLQISGNSGSGCHICLTRRSCCPKGKTWQNITLWGGSLLLRLLYDPFKSRQKRWPCFFDVSKDETGAATEPTPSICGRGTGDRSDPWDPVALQFRLQGPSNNTLVKN